MSSKVLDYYRLTNNINIETFLCCKGNRHSPKELDLRTFSIIEIAKDSTEHITPVAAKEIMESDIIITDKKLLHWLDLDHKEVIDIDDGFDKVSRFISEQGDEKKIVLIVSEHEECKKLQHLITQKQDTDYVKIVPGKGALRYLAGKYKLPWENVNYCNFFYSQREFLKRVRNHEQLYTFTDRVWSPQAIARYLLIYDLGDADMLVGLNLSYEDELIFREQASVLAHDQRELGLAIVIILNDSTLLT